MMEREGKKKYYFWLMFAALILAGVLVHRIEINGEAKVSRNRLSEFPAQLGDWKKIGSDQRFDDKTEAMLKADDAVLRDYKGLDGRVANVYISYYLSQRTGATYHSPRNCIPGSGWMMTDPKIVKIRSGNREFEANLYIIENAGYKAILIYWYQGRGRSVASEYKDKLYTIFDSITKRRSDGSIVRVIMPFAENEENDQNRAVTAAEELAGKIYPELPDFIPN